MSILFSMLLYRFRHQHHYNPNHVFNEFSIDIYPFSLFGKTYCAVRQRVELLSIFFINLPEVPPFSLNVCESFVFRQNYFLPIPFQSKSLFHSILQIVLLFFCSFSVGAHYSALNECFYFEFFIYMPAFSGAKISDVFSSGWIFEIIPLFWLCILFVEDSV